MFGSCLRGQLPTSKWRRLWVLYRSSRLFVLEASQKSNQEASGKHSDFRLPRPALWCHQHLLEHEGIPL
ncbi:hypothetical protein RRG08_037147 [Elysia crispata]|uniref:Uncharacterized protein n=1 Tax=Elysia crispata TaxID=231223 RepID=A0AAE1A5P7_9GAST|nr:hypothetical protein RRG08_037147 [Elysia crispata]